MNDAEVYFKAMLDGRIDRCARIEQRHDLYAYPPELVTVGLNAVAEGKDAHEAIDAYMKEPQP